jgi:hypothetical protein
MVWLPDEALRIYSAPEDHCPSSFAYISVSPAVHTSLSPCPKISITRESAGIESRVKLGLEPVPSSNS